jgi:segregation and condensation protein B
MYATTREFLDYFNLKTLGELPSLADIKEISSLSQELELEAAMTVGIDAPQAEAASDLGEAAGDAANESENLAEGDAANESANEELVEVKAAGIDTEGDDSQIEALDEDTVDPELPAYSQSHS